MKDPDIEHFFESPLDKEIAEANSDIDKNKARKYLSILKNAWTLFKYVRGERNYLTNYQVLFFDP